MKQSFHFSAALLAGMLFWCASALANDSALTNSPALANSQALPNVQALAYAPAAGDNSSAISGFFVAPQVGTLGLGLNVGYQFNEKLKVRLNANHMSFKTSRTVSDIDFNMKFKNNTIGALVDAHPAATNFRLTGGLYYVDMSADLTAKLAEGKSYDVGGETYTSDQLGNGTGSVKWERFAPYLGFGFGAGGGDEPGFSFSGDLGLLFFGKPKVSVRFADSAYADNPELAENTREYEDKAKRDINYYLPFFPVLSLGCVYRF
jgi:hypothetical protein